MPRLCDICRTYDKFTAMHRYPSYQKFPDRFKEWVRITGGKLETDEDYKSYQERRVCDKHFSLRDRNRYRRLNALAVPSRHLSAGDTDAPLSGTSKKAEEDNAAKKSNEDNDSTEVLSEHYDDDNETRSLYEEESLHGPDSDSKNVPNKSLSEQQSHDSGKSQKDPGGSNEHVEKESNDESQNTLSGNEIDNIEEVTPCDKKDEDQYETVIIDDNDDRVPLLMEVESNTALQEEETERHEHVKCNNCEGDIVGSRYVCAQCSDYDLCVTCESTGHHATHYVLRVPAGAKHGEVTRVLEGVKRQLMWIVKSPETIDMKQEDEIKEEDKIINTDNVIHEEYTYCDYLKTNLNYAEYDAIVDNTNVETNTESHDQEIDCENVENYKILNVDDVDTVSAYFGKYTEASDMKIDEETLDKLALSSTVASQTYPTFTLDPGTGMLVAIDDSNALSETVMEQLNAITSVPCAQFELLESHVPVARTTRKRTIQIQNNELVSPEKSRQKTGGDGETLLYDKDTHTISILKKKQL